MTRTDTQAQKAGQLFVAIVCGVLLGAGLLWILDFRSGRGGPSAALDPDSKPRTPESRTPFDAEEQQAIGVFAAAKDSVVSVDTVVRVRRFDLRVQEQQTGTGSGFVWDDNRRIVTNFHVIREAAGNRGAVGIRVVLGDKTVWNADIIGIAPDYDLALLQLDSNAPLEKLKPIKLGTSKDLEVGQKTFAIGNPFGLSLSMTKGIVSALDRQIESPTSRPITGAIQTDAPINPGNSGGPLLDKDARLIGVNTSIATPSGGNVGIGFAIPADTVNSVVTELIQRGRVLQPDIGVQLVDQRRLRRSGFATGVMIEKVEPSSPAAQAGLLGLQANPQTGDVRLGDLILAIDGQPIQTPLDYARALGRAKIGETIRLTIERNEKRLEVEVKVRGV